MNNATNKYFKWPFSQTIRKKKNEKKKNKTKKNKRKEKTIKTLRSLKRKISGEFKRFKTGVMKNLLEIQIKI